jgi:hypothetical protein
VLAFLVGVRAVGIGLPLGFLIGLGHSGPNNFGIFVGQCEHRPTGWTGNL